MTDYKFRGIASRDFNSSIGDVTIKKGQWVFGCMLHDVGIRNTKDRRVFIANFIYTGDGCMECGAPVMNQIEVIPETVGLFSGIHDNTKWDDLTDQEKDAWLKADKTQEEWKGREIYENDIVTGDLDFEPTGRVGLTGKIIFQSGMFLFWRGEYDFCELKRYHNIKVIGNIHNNGELLEVKK